MEVLILYLVRKLQGNRSLSGVIHILKGKRSAQTIQDLSLFHLENWAGVLRNNTYQQLREAGDYLYSELLISDKENKTAVTQKGEKYLKDFSKDFDSLKLQGRKYEWNGEAEDFWQRLSLLIQTLSWLKAGNSHFIPVNADYYNKKAVKTMLKHHGTAELSASLEKWLHIHLQTLAVEEAELFVSRLSGAAQHGVTFHQLGKNKQEAFILFLRFRTVLHFLMDQKDTIPGSLKSLIPEKNSISGLTISAAATKEWVEQGLRIQEIAEKRKLKMSTIEDHLVELAMYDPVFPYKNYVSPIQLTKIRTVVEQLGGSSSLKQLRESLEQKVSYFEIRLALALFYQWEKEMKDA